MIALSKVLVVDNGHREGGDLLSTELAELGLSSVTTSFEAANEVLHVIERPSAIVLKMPLAHEGLPSDGFERFAAQLRHAARSSGIPVIEWDQDAALRAGGLSAMLRNEVGTQASPEAES